MVGEGDGVSAKILLAFPRAKRMDTGAGPEVGKCHPIQMPLRAATLGGKRISALHPTPLPPQPLLCPALLHPPSGPNLSCLASIRAIFCLRVDRNYHSVV